MQTGTNNTLGDDDESGTIPSNLKLKDKHDEVTKKNLRLLMGIGTKQTSFKIKAQGNQWEEIDRGEFAFPLSSALKKLKPTGNFLPEDVETILQSQYPPQLNRPTPSALDESLLQEPIHGLPFGPGNWCEFYGTDQRWHLAQVRRVYARAPLGFNPKTHGIDVAWEYSYNFGREANVPPYLIRAPTEAIERAYGTRPFVFLQYCLLRVESMIQFQERHQRDFEQMSFTFSAETLWDQFLMHPANEDFKKLFDASEKNSQDKLLDYILSTFRGMDRISSQNSPGARWDFKTQNISVYTYPSLLGSGWITVFIILILQLGVPALLLKGAIDVSDRFVNSTTTAELFCKDEIFRDEQSFESLLMNLLVIILYLLRVAPRVIDTFFQTIGEGTSPASRLNNLRSVVWKLGHDTFFMQVGYRLEKLLKSVYMTLVVMVMLFVLFLSGTVLDIILNALAIEFIWELDIEYAKSPQFDPKRRWIKAAAVECRFRATLDLDSLDNPHVFCQRYGITPEEYKNAFNGEWKQIKNQHQAYLDSVDENYMSENDLIWAMASDIAQDTQNNNAIWQFSPNLEVFGYFDKLLVNVGIKSTGMFRRYFEYRTWSIWEILLFLPPVPAFDGNSTKIALLNAQEGLGYSMRSLREKKDLYDNYSLNILMKTKLERFLLDFVDTLCFKTFYQNLKVAWKKGQYLAIPFRVFDGLLEWLSYIIQVLFPFMMVGMFSLNLICY